MVDKATQRLATSDDFADWAKDKSKGTQPLSDAERLRLNNLEKENAQLRKENAQWKASKQSSPSTGASAVGNTGCFKYKVWEGRAPCGSMPGQQAYTD